MLVGGARVLRETVRGGSLSCTPLGPMHGEELHDAIVRSSKQLCRWMSWCHEGFTVEEARNWATFCQTAWDAGTHFEFAVHDSEHPYMGACGLSGVDRDRATANLAYWTRSDLEGRRVASRAARLIAAWGIGRLGIQRIRILMPTANVASRRVAERAGAVFEEFLRDHAQIGGKPYNFLRYALTPADFHEDELA